MSEQKIVSFHTLGCKLNFSETSTIARQFEAGGFRRAKRGETADICVINSCSVTDHADKKCRNLIRKLSKENPAALIAVTGCYAQLKPAEIASIEGVDLVVGNNNKGELYEKVSQISGKGTASIYSCDSDELTNFFAAFSTGDRTRAFLKVQDGCNYKCSYCTIPYARGASRNMSITELVTEAEQIALAGQKEIVITGINTGDFGRTTGETFIDLIRELDKVDGIERYRISSIEPNLLTDEILEFTTRSTKFQPHFHIPLQSGDNEILGLMRRRYTTERFAERIEAVRRFMPDVFIGIDVIVGFPGETEEHFNNTYQLLERLAPAYLHVFPYSERPGTPAVDFAEKVSPQVASERVRRLTDLCHRLHDEFSRKHIGQTAKVLFESSQKNGMIFGYTENYIKVEMPFERRLINTISNVKLEQMCENGNIRVSECQ